MAQENVNSSRASLLALSLLLISLATGQISIAGVGSAKGPEQGTERDHDAPVNVIFDTDIWGDIDDALALAMLHALQDRHEINLLAVTISTDEPSCASYVDLINTFYHHTAIPLGITHQGVTAADTIKKFPTAVPQRSNYTEKLSEARNSSGEPAYPHNLSDGSKVPDAVALLRKTLATQPDGSVVIIQVGFSTNMARLLQTRPDTLSALGGLELVRQKVKLLSVMAGWYEAITYEGRSYPKGMPEFNLVLDVPGARALFARWPTPIVASGVEIGARMLFPAISIEHDFSYAQPHPIADTYRVYATSMNLPWPHDHPTFDLTSVLYAARPDRHYFSLSKPGKITVLPDGGSRFDEVEGGMHRYLILDEAQKERTLEAMVMLASQPPRQAPASTVP